MDDDVLSRKFRTHGIRNTLLQPASATGTIQPVAGNVVGIEPVFAYTAPAKCCKGTIAHEEGSSVGKMWRDLKGDAGLLDYFVNAQTLPMDHVRMQAAAQMIRSSI
jgi:ribonucleoside-diphosphate reductase alpha chain